MSDHYDEHEEQRETLRQHRPVGPRGPRKPRKDGKPHTRVLSKREQENAEGVVRAVIKNCALKLTDAQRSNTEEILRHDFKLEVSEKGPPAILKAVLRSNNRHRVIKGSKKYLEAVIYAFALYDIIVSSDEHDMGMYIGLISEHTNIPLTPCFHLLRAVLRLAIDYEEAKEPKSDNHGKWSRDAQAIEWLLSQGIRPDGVRNYQKKYGGGVDKWSRLAAKPANATKKQVVEVAASRMEHDHVKRADPNSCLNELDEDEKSKKAHGKVTKWGNMDPGTWRSRERNRLEKLGAEGPWHSEMLLYYRREKGIGPGEGIITMVIGDPGSPLGVREVGTLSVGHVTSDECRLAKGFKLLASRLSIVLSQDERFSWNEAAWRHDRDNARAVAERRRASWLPRGRPYKPKH
jgi:hypothetical protein